LFEKMDVFWDAALRRPDFPPFYKELIALRKAHAALRTGTVEWLANSDQARVLTYRRLDQSADIVVAINVSNKPFIGTVEASGDYSEITPPAVKGRQAGTAALPAISLDAWGVRIFRRAR
jgi:glycosidase